METNLEGPDGSYIKTSECGVDIKGPSGRIQTGGECCNGGEGGVGEGDTLDDATAQKIVDENSEYYIEDGYLHGPNGFKAKIGEKLDATQAEQLAKDAPNATKGGKEPEGAKEPGGGGGTPKQHTGH